MLNKLYVQRLDMPVCSGCGSQLGGKEVKLENVLIAANNKGAKLLSNLFGFRVRSNKEEPYSTYTFH